MLFVAFRGHIATTVTYLFELLIILEFLYVTISRPPVAALVVLTILVSPVLDFTIELLMLLTDCSLHEFLPQGIVALLTTFKI